MDHRISVAHRKILVRPLVTRGLAHLLRVSASASVRARTRARARARTGVRIRARVRIRFRGRVSVRARGRAHGGRATELPA